jgi:hypothetical protein
MKRPAMVLGIAGPTVSQKSAPYSAKHSLHAKHQAVAHHAYGQTTYPGKKFNDKEVNRS